ncbi:ABC transporter permease [Gordonia rubripertincta]|uniref:ABC transporter permease n=1 Tax=Gordonia rubripertincta TaxID=36822 RepID=A0AAW4G9S1_GORRU|nr:ABC transporter permease [Gordonia rubripertincta]MBM7280312.1 ABC transporter permease [Gordonia rubripertincta]QMU20771.1 ABC transporter permease [Gordonia rubripertincta]
MTALHDIPTTTPRPSSRASAAQAIRLVAEREITTRAKTRSFVVSTAVLMVVIVVGAILINLFAGGEDVEKVAVVGQPAAITESIVAVGDSAGTSIATEPVDTVEQARTKVADGDVAAALVPGETAGSYVILSKDGADPAVEGPIRTAVSQAGLTDALAARGVDAASLPAVDISVTQLDPARPDEGERLVIALVGVILLITAIMMGGTMVAVGVVEEKTSRVVELLLATIKPLHLLWGKIIGIGAVALTQVVLLGATALIAGTATGILTLPGAAVGMFAAVIAWFVLGFLFFASLYAATGAIVSRQEELSSASFPLTVLAMAVMYAGIFGVQSLDSTLIKTLSWIPPFSAALMPMRIASGDTNTLQIVLTFLFMAAACALATWVAARIYQRSILRTGSRLSWGEVLKLAR